MCATPGGLETLLPDRLPGWTASGADRVYGPEDLYDYIDGGAELFISFDFVQALARTYTREGQPDIVVDLFDMGASRNAYGVFSMSRETLERDFGQGSQYTEGLLLFWKDRYYVSVLASPETPEAREALFALARAVEGAVSREGPEPELLSLLPAGGLVAESVRYFRHPIWLNSHYYVADENIFGMGGDSEAVLAKYGGEERPVVLLLIRYPDRAKAKAGRAGFIAGFLPESSEGRAVRIEDGSWTGCRLEGTVLAVVFQASGPEQVGRLLEAAGPPGNGGVE